MKNSRKATAVTMLMIAGEVAGRIALADTSTDTAADSNTSGEALQEVTVVAQKQNIGLLSFIAAGTNKVPLSAWERRTLMVAWLPAGITQILETAHNAFRHRRFEAISSESRVEPRHQRRAWPRSCRDRPLGGADRRVARAGQRGVIDG